MGKSAGGERQHLVQPHLGVGALPTYVLTPGDPGRCDEILAQMENPCELRHNREFRVSSGNYAGLRIGVVATGIGCPSAAIAIEESTRCGADVFVRIGTCGGLLPEMEPGDIVIPNSAYCQDGTTREYGGSDYAAADESVYRALMAAADAAGIRAYTGINRTHDAFYERDSAFMALEGMGFVSSEMECSAVFLVSALRGARAGAVLVVNTPESFQQIREDPDAIHRLADPRRTEQGVRRAVALALEACRTLELEKRQSP